MAYDVSSNFLSKLADPFAEVGRRFTIAGSDYSSYVSSWPKFKRSWNDIRPKALTLNLANEEQTFNFFRDDRTLLTSNCEVQMGIDEDDILATEAGSLLTTEDGQTLNESIFEEYISVFAGTMEKIKYAKGSCRITINDKFKQLGEKIIGDSDVPVDYTGSSYLVSDLAWYICTSHAGYSSIQSSSNPDIDYDSFLTWSNVFSSDNVLVKAYFDGQNANVALRKIGRITQSAIFIKDNKISFHRFSLTDSNQTDFNSSNIAGLEDTIDNRNIVNKQYVFGNYDVSSKTYGIAVNNESTSSVNSYGLREIVEKDPVVWYVDSVSCLNLAQRSTLTKDEPYDDIVINSSLIGLTRQVGETATVVDSLLGINDSYRIMEVDLDTDKGKMNFRVERTQIIGAFILDVSELDGADVLT